jgi:DNA-binding beta-propeller fold protein YncE
MSYRVGMRNLAILPVFAAVIICLLFSQNANATSVVKTIPVGTNPYGVAYDHAKGEIFVANHSDNSISVIS